MEQRASYEIEQLHSAASARDYLSSNPQINQLMHDFTTAVLINKPTDVKQFAKEYFNQFNTDSNNNPSIVPAAVAGAAPSAASTAPPASKSK